MQILEALKASHRTGIVHRDVKPQNVIISETDNKVKFIDMGAAADLRVGINYVPNEYLLDPRYAPPQQYIMSTQVGLMVPLNPLLLSPPPTPNISPTSPPVLAVGVGLQKKGKSKGGEKRSTPLGVITGASLQASWSHSSILKQSDIVLAMSQGQGHQEILAQQLLLK